MATMELRFEEAPLPPDCAGLPYDLATYVLPLFLAF
jgi:hypothetical protein